MSHTCQPIVRPDNTLPISHYDYYPVVVDHHAEELPSTPEKRTWHYAEDWADPRLLRIKLENAADSAYQGWSYPKCRPLHACKRDEHPRNWFWIERHFRWETAQEWYKAKAKFANYSRQHQGLPPLDWYEGFANAWAEPPSPFSRHCADVRLIHTYTDTENTA